MSKVGLNIVSSLQPRRGHQDSDVFPGVLPVISGASARAAVSLSFTFLKLSRPTLLDIATHEENVLHDILWSHDTHTYYYSLSSRQIDF